MGGLLGRAAVDSLAPVRTLSGKSGGGWASFGVCHCVLSCQKARLSSLSLSLPAQYRSSQIGWLETLGSGSPPPLRRHMRQKHSKKTEVCGEEREADRGSWFWEGGLEWMGWEGSEKQAAVCGYWGLELFWSGVVFYVRLVAFGNCPAATTPRMRRVRDQHKKKTGSKMLPTYLITLHTSKRQYMLLFLYTVQQKHTLIHVNKTCLCPNSHITSGQSASKCRVATCTCTCEFGAQHPGLVCLFPVWHVRVCVLCFV